MENRIKLSLLMTGEPIKPDFKPRLSFAQVAKNHSPSVSVRFAGTRRHPDMNPGAFTFISQSDSNRSGNF